MVSATAGATAGRALASGTVGDEPPKAYACTVNTAFDCTLALSGGHVR